jgi:ubiquinone/menaquinone biosynthesis C-methylase UbiE
MSAAAQAGYELPFVSEYYDFLPLTQGRQDLDFYLYYARAAGDPILELGCGTGRILLPLAEAGHWICGLDFSEQMLARCRKKLEAERPEVRERVRLVQGNMVSFDLQDTFRLITIPFRPFQHLLKVEDQMACLHAAHRHLQPGGKIILDLFQTDARRMHDPAWLNEMEAHPEVMLANGRKVRLAERVVAFHRAEQMNDVELIYYVTHPDGRKERLVHAFTIRYFFRYEVEHLLQRCGFHVLDVFGKYDRSPLLDDSQDMLFVAEKTA